ncbi:hypothetical protein C0995_009555 [Termitomyces sp. Mi166|nr:hypothetical protein C0995_009555 [Termitomyces sp. Mi166\
MSFETKTRDASACSPPAEGDHRKRRRNRTTQSCLNCHNSKRMTGLCVYEIDDPSQRSDSQDEIACLLKRIAELEGVIREVTSFVTTKKQASSSVVPDSK